MAVEGSVLQSLGINGFTLVGQIVNFLILLFILKKFVYRPILTKLEERNITIKKGLEAAEKNITTQKDLEAKFEEKMSKAETEADKIIAAAKKDAEKAKDEIIAQAKEASQKVMEKRNAEIESKLRTQEKELEKKIVDIARDMSAKVLEGLIDKKTQEVIIKAQLQELEAVKLSK
jgi:F-type H+-transporting ATPase subunit b